MALIKTITTDSGVIVQDAYHKIFRFEVRTAGAVISKDVDDNDVLSPTVTAEVQVCSYPDKARADADAPVISNSRFVLPLSGLDGADLAAALADVGTVTSAFDLLKLMKSVLYRGLAKLPEFQDAVSDE